MPSDSHTTDPHTTHIDLTTTTAADGDAPYTGQLLQDDAVPMQTTPPTVFDRIRSTTASVVQHATHVTINHNQLNIELAVHQQRYTADALPPTWAQSYHYCDPADDATTAQYVFVLDALNYCFWPCQQYEYEHLASSLKGVLTNDKHAFSADRLIGLTCAQLQQWLQPLDKNTHSFKQSSQHTGSHALQTTNTSLVPIPLLSQRVLSLRELGYALQNHYDGLAVNMIRAAKHSANTLIQSILTHLPMFRDHCVYNVTGAQTHYYKRAQILIGDLFGAFNGQGCGQFDDSTQLTCFADYRIPQLLRHMNILQYSPALQQIIDSGAMIDAGSVYENEIRACTVQVVECMQQLLKERGVNVMALQIDWLLWERGEAHLSTLPPHHKTLTVYY